MKTPIEAIDATISHLQALRQTLTTPAVVDAMRPYNDAAISPMMLHFMSGPQGGEEPKTLARLFSSKWHSSRDSTSWMAELPSVVLCIHNAEPARNPQPETVEL